MANIIGTLPVTLQNGTIADASQVMSDFNFIVNQVNANALAATATIPGVFLGAQVFSSNSTYTPNPLASKAWVRAIGGGGGGAGSGSSGTGISIGLGGAAGAYGELLITAGLSTQTITIGFGGTGGTGGNGGNGGNTSFGSLMVCAGGTGGSILGPASPPLVIPFQQAPATVTGSGNIIVSGVGPIPAVPVIVIANATLASGPGAASMWGTGGNSITGSGNGAAAQGFGSGGGGAATVAAASVFTGGAGGRGYMVIFEFA